jgi:hypothetical protein
MATAASKRDRNSLLKLKFTLRRDFAVSHAIEQNQHESRGNSRIFTIQAAAGVLQSARSSAVWAVSAEIATDDNESGSR